MSQFSNSSNLNPFRKAYFNSKVDTSLPQFNTYRNKIDEDEAVEENIQQNKNVVTANPNIETRIDTRLPQFNQYRNKKSDDDDDRIETPDKIVIDETFFAKLIGKINKCVNDWYSRNFNDDDKKDFTPCCSEEEKDILKKCILLVQENTDFPSDDIYLGVIQYYYSSIVLEYYASKENKFNCFNIYNTNLPKAVKVRDMITVSDEPWASQVRRAINFAAKKGGRRLRRKMYRKKSYKNSRNTRKTRKARKTRRNMRR